MRTVLLCALLLVTAAPASAALPKAGMLVPGRSLGGIHLGETATQVRAALGSSYGVCRGCSTTTWYFTYRPFDRHGLAVELARGRVSGVYTVWKPSGWSTTSGLGLGAAEAALQTLAGPLVPIVCRSEEHTSELQSRFDLVCRLLLEKKKKKKKNTTIEKNFTL